MSNNPVGIKGLEFIELTSPDVNQSETLCKKLGMTMIGRHKTEDLRLYRQNHINFIVNNTENSFAHEFRESHGPSVSATGFKVENANKAFQVAVERGAKPFTGDVKAKGGWTLPAVYGIGDSLIYFVDSDEIYDQMFEYNTTNKKPNSCNLQIIDHLTNNVPQGEMQKWCDFYTNIFGFEERRYFDIRGKQTGLFSKVMQSPSKNFSIPVNEPQDSKSQIQEYLDEYKGSGVQHIALLAPNICETMEVLHKNDLEFLDAPPDTYYEMLPKRVKNIRENLTDLKRLHLLADGDDEGYLLQIFTKNQIGPVFIEIIQRRNHTGFGDGNFQALFDAMEADQKKRGVL